MLKSGKKYVDANGDKCLVVATSYLPAALVEFESGQRVMVTDGSCYEQGMREVERTVMLDMGPEMPPRKLTQQECLDVRNEIMNIAESCDHERLPEMMRANAMLRE